MGMYTDIYVNVDFKEDTPDSIISVVAAICNKEYPKTPEDVLAPYPQRWPLLFNRGSYYTTNTEAQYFHKDGITKQWSLLGKGDIKNYECEIQEFFEFIAPFVDDEFMGYIHYEEDILPTLVVQREGKVHYRNEERLI